MSTIGSHQARRLRGLKKRGCTRRITRVIAVEVFTTSALLGSLTETASVSADRCVDVDVVFARGTGEPAGVGQVGQAFVDSLGKGWPNVPTN
jgi:hypothetical protein